MGVSGARATPGGRVPVRATQVTGHQQERSAWVTARGPEHSLRYGVGVFSSALLLLLVLRVLLDRFELGFAVAITLIFATFLLLSRAKGISRRILVVSAIFLFIVLFGYLNAVLTHGEVLFSARGLVRYFCYIAVIWVAYLSNVTFRQIYVAYGFVILIQAAVAVVERTIFGVDRPYGTLINSNHISYLLVPYAAVTLIYFRNYVRCIWIVVFAAFLGGLGGVLALLTVLGGYLLINARIAVRLLFIALTPFLLFGLTVVLEHRISEQADIVEIEERLSSGQVGGGGSLVWRVVTWKLMFEELQEAERVVLGRGLDYASVASPYFLTASRFEPHNDYVRILLEFGALGLLIYLLLYLRATAVLLKMGVQDRRFIALGWALIGLAVGQLVGNIVVQSTLWWFFFAMFGAILAETGYLRRASGYRMATQSINVDGTDLNLGH
jgi:O-antigen ligase